VIANTQGISIDEAVEKIFKDTLKEISEGSDSTEELKKQMLAAIKEMQDHHKE
jgi:hypothetical protein